MGVTSSSSASGGLPATSTMGKLSGDGYNVSQQTQQDDNDGGGGGITLRNIAAPKHKPAAMVKKGSTNIDLPPQPADGVNTIKRVFLDDVKMIDSRHAQRMPPLIKNEIDKAVGRDAARICYETEKKMARCVQDKLYTAWKCQKERDEYYACTYKYKTDPEVMNAMFWKYNLGTFHGEIVARRRLMQALWQEYFPDREINHEWAQE